jgi:hypothetical protein
MFPSRVVETVLAEHQDEYAAAVGAQLSAGVEINPQEPVWAPKPGPVGRYRWLTVLPIRERVLFRALVQDIEADVPMPDRSPDAFEAFQAAPLEAAHLYVAVGDVASFYFFVDHQLLESRLVETSARADTAEALCALLAATGGRSYGLPQNFSPSDALSEAYISWVERRLARADIPTYRHNDDFRLGADSWGGALQALERLGEELSMVGLELNGEKSWILSRDTYEANLRLASEIFDQAVPPTYPAVDPYTGEPLDPDADVDLTDEEALRISEAVWDAAAANRLSGDRMSGFELRANRQLLNTALYYFRRVKANHPLELGPALVAVDPAFAHSYALYLQGLAENDANDETNHRIVDVLARFGGHAPFWVQAWLAEPLLTPGTRMNDEVERWLRGFLTGRAPALLRARAALALAVHHRVEVAELTELFDAFPSAAAPDIAAALGFRQPAADDRRVRAVIESQHLYRWIYDYAAAHADDCRWA